MRDNYEQSLKDIQKETGEYIKNLIICDFDNNIIQKYGNWEKYPRKIKKMLKIKKLWQFRNCEPLKYNDVQIEWR